MLPDPVSEDAFEEIVRDVKRKFSVKPKVAIAGFGKSGKSSLFNAIYGAEVASVSMRTDETEAAQTEERFGIDFTDTPGVGTSKFSLDKVVEMGVFEKQHIVLHVLNGVTAISAEDEHLHEVIEQCSAARITVVNKADLLDEREKNEFAQSVEEKLGLFEKDFLFVSAKTGDGLSELVEAITDALPDAMQDAFIAQQRANTRIKERRVRALVYAKAAVCAAFALTPAPVADIFVITPIQIAMITAIGYLHGVELTKKRVIEFMTTVAAAAGFREAARQLIKLVPGYGSAVSAGVAFAGTVALGEAANIWFKNQMKVDADELQRVFKERASEAQEEYEAHAQESEAIRPKVEALRARLEAGEISEDDYERELAEL